MILTIYTIGMILGIIIYLYQNRKALKYIFPETVITAIIAGVMWPVYFVSEIIGVIKWGR